MLTWVKIQFKFIPFNDSPTLYLTCSYSLVVAIFAPYIQGYTFGVNKTHFWVAGEEREGGILLTIKVYWEQTN